MVHGVPRDTKYIPRVCFSKLRVARMRSRAQIISCKIPFYVSKKNVTTLSFETNSRRENIRYFSPILFRRGALSFYLSRFVRGGGENTNIAGKQTILRKLNQGGNSGEAFKVFAKLCIKRESYTPLNALLILLITCIYSRGWIHFFRPRKLNVTV